MKPNETAYIKLARRLKKRRKVMTAAVILGIVLLSGFLSVAFPVASIMGSCMEPAYKNGDDVLTSRFIYRFISPQRGDVVAVTVNNSMAIKRVIGLPGETVKITNGNIYIDGKLIKDDYISDKMCSNELNIEITLKANEYYLMSDNNEDQSGNSQVDGCVTSENIKLKVLFRVF